MNNYLRWGATIIWALIIWRLTTIPDLRVSDNSTLSMLLSNGGHLFFFGVLACLIPVSRFWSLTSTFLYGLSIELVQRTVPGRSFSLLDLGLDVLGAISMLWILTRISKRSNLQLDGKKAR